MQATIRSYRVSNSIVLGKGIADKMMADVGEIIQITTAKGDQVSLKVVGIFQLGLATVDDVQSYASLETAQKILGKSNSYYTDIQIKLTDIKTAPATAKEYAKIFNIDADMKNGQCTVRIRNHSPQDYNLCC